MEMMTSEQRLWLVAEEQLMEMEREAILQQTPPPAPLFAAEGMENRREGGAGGDADSERERQELYNTLFNDDVDDFNGSTFFNEFPALPDFPCMSSSSSSSSTRAAAVAAAQHSPVASTNSGSSANSWAVLGQPPPENHQRATTPTPDHHLYFQNPDEQAPPGALASTASMEVSHPPPPPLPEHHQQPEPDEIDIQLNACTDADECMNVMADLGYMDLFDNPDIWDPSSIFGALPTNNDTTMNEFPVNDQHQLQPQPQLPQQQQPEQVLPAAPTPVSGGGEAVGLDNLFFIEGNEELSEIFFGWLKKYKGEIGAEDIRGIKLKRHTLEAALKRLGYSRQGKIMLLKLILEWVEIHQLPKKWPAATRIEPATPGFDLNRNPNPDPMTPVPWTPAPAPEYNYVNVSDINPYNNSGGVYNGSGNLNYYPPAPEQYHHPTPTPMECGPQPWNVIPGQLVMAPPPQPQYQQFNNPPPPHGTLVHIPNHGVFRVVNGYPYPVLENVNMNMNPNMNVNMNPNMNMNMNNNPPPPPPPARNSSRTPAAAAAAEKLDKLPRLSSSASKEARKKRMARHKRIFHHRHHQTHQQKKHAQAVQEMIAEQQKLMRGGVDPSIENWVFWHPAGAPPSAATGLVPAAVDPPIEMATVQQRSQSGSASRSKSDMKNLRFLLQKVLKQSDVGTLGRIVLPKREAELHLPELGSRDGVTLALEDIGNNSRVFTMRYRYWPNNKSRMYILENTGEFVRVNELQEGDFIVIYSDAKCSKYMIRGVKVRGQAGAKAEPKKAAEKKKKGASKLVLEIPDSPEAAM